MIDLLVVDDSAVVRQVITSMLADQSDISVRVAADALIARNKIRVKRPDVLLLDLQMPRMDGLTFLRELSKEDFIPTVVCSSQGARGSDAAMQALSIGATEVIEKPRVNVADFLNESKVLLVDAIRGAARVQTCPPRQQSPATVRETPQPLSDLELSSVVIALGASTGGTEALATVLRGMPANSPGIVVVQHMPAGFTAAFAKRLDGLCAVRVKEAEKGDRVAPGMVLIAAGNRHLVVRGRHGNYSVDVFDGQLVSRHRPSVDVLFESMADVVGANGVGVIMTGMGNDGARGLGTMRRAGATTLAQDEATSVVFGMPKEAIAAGAVDEVVPLPEIANAVLRAVARKHELKTPLSL